MFLRLDGIGKGFGARRLFEDVQLHVGAGDRIGLVGPNGAGKTTLLRIAAGLEDADTGQRSASRGARIAMLRQEIDPALERSVREEAASALATLNELAIDLAEMEAEMARLGEAGEDIPAALAERYDQSHHRFEVQGGFEREARVERVLAGLGFDEEARGRPLRTFSGGWLMRVELAKLFLRDPDVLLLDEPTNHLDLPSIQWFEETLQQFRGGIVVISHDRTFLRRHATRIAELTPLGFTVYESGYDGYLQERERRFEELLARKRSQDRKIAETERFIDRFRYKASKARQVQSRVKSLERLDRVEVQPKGTRRMRLKIPAPPRAGAVVMTLDGIHKAYDEKVVYEGIDLEVARNERVALVGPNGAGKSTLLRILAGVLPIDGGHRTPGHNVQIAFYAQHQLEALDASRTVLAELESDAHIDDVPRLRGHLGAFLFSGDDVEKRVSVLSGGEKARLALAKLLLRPSNVLVLDEPTNHLDVDACEVLEDALREYQGTLLFISHDRSFINALATKVIEVKDGQLRTFLGNYDAYLEHLAPRTETRQAPKAAAEAAGPATVTKPASAAPVAPAARTEAREVRRVERERKKARDRVQRKIETTEASILEKETEIEALGWKLGDPEVYRDKEQLQTLQLERDEVKTAIANLYADWERLAAELEVLSEDSPET